MASLRGPWIALLLLPVPAAAQSRDAVIPSGIAFGASYGLNSFGGPANGAIENAGGWEFFLGGGLDSGMFARIGFALSAHDIPPAVPSWDFVSFFVEPRWVVRDLSPAMAPFLAARAARLTEQVVGRSYEFHGSGWAYGGGGGVLFRVAPQIALEIGGLLGRVRFGDYTYRGEFAWKDCLDHLEAGTALPASVAGCAGSRSVGGVVRLCYPPYHENETGFCDPPDIPYAGTSRSGRWLRAWIGVHLSLSTAAGR